MTATLLINRDLKEVFHHLNHIKQNPRIFLLQNLLIHQTLKKGNGNYKIKKGELGSIRTSLAYISKNMRILNQQNQVLINTFKSEKDRTTKAFKLMKNEQKETTAAIKEMKAELIGMKKEQHETNKLLKKLISIIKKEKKVSIQVNKDNMNKKDNISQFMN